MKILKKSCSHALGRNFDWILFKFEYVVGISWESRPIENGDDSYKVKVTRAGNVTDFSHLLNIVANFDPIYLKD